MLSAFFGGLDHLLGLKLVANQILGKPVDEARQGLCKYFTVVCSIVEPPFVHCIVTYKSARRSELLHPGREAESVKLLTQWNVRSSAHHRKPLQAQPQHRTCAAWRSTQHALSLEKGLQGVSFQVFRGLNCGSLGPHKLAFDFEPEASARRASPYAHFVRFVEKAKVFLFSLLCFKSFVWIAAT